MKKDTLISVLLWTISVLLMLSLAIYQRATGPTYPVRGKVEINGETVRYKLLRSHDTGIDAPVEIAVPAGVSAIVRYKRFKSFDEWTTVNIEPADGIVRWGIPNQPPAGKVEYQIALLHQDNAITLTEEPVIIRFKGVVPAWALIPHVFFMFFAMVYSIRTGFEVMFKRNNTFKLTGITVLLLLIGGLILGPIVQKFAFDAYWTGWPWGHDLTDNKTIVAFIFWVIAWLILRRNPANRVWPLVATIVMLAVYLIPHSVLGSEIDHTKTQSQPQTEISE